MDGSFIFYGIPPGEYILEFPFIFGQYETIKVILPDGPENSDSGIKAFTLNPANREINQFVTLPLSVQPLNKYQYFEIQEEFTIWSIVKNPYFLMIAAPIFFMWLMKKMPNPDQLQGEEAPPQPPQPRVRNQQSSSIYAFLSHLVEPCP
eukprot:TRINITY_DN1817_c0_g1_i6.p1 TRINITY_DN1817_c0_g1~~TRINITY_DN1817_c0_g1_i6.p1  ORF type:complete len:149 (+),score=29.69 TRINITY_DN1817_c0_g1_i6:379-825(+)